MIFGMTPYTFFHVLLSLIGIFTGFIALFGMIAGKRLDAWNGIFLLTTTLTSITRIARNIPLASRQRFHFFHGHIGLLANLQIFAGRNQLAFYV